MADYACKHCKFFNNGWCVAKKKNGLTGTYECELFEEGKYGEFRKSKIGSAESDTKLNDIIARINIVAREIEAIRKEISIIALNSRTRI